MRSFCVTAAEGSHGNVLIVEDERIVALYLQRTLQILGYNVPATAASASGALAIAERWPPRIVLMDLRLHGSEDGVEAAVQLRALCSFALIYIAGGMDKSARDRASATYPDAWLQKPFSQTQLEAALRAVELRLI